MMTQIAKRRNVNLITSKVSLESLSHVESIKISAFILRGHHQAVMK